MARSERASRWWWPAVAGGAVLGAAVVGVGAGFDRPLAADDKPAADARKGDDKPAFKPEDVRVGAPPELEALRKAVEDAAKKGENVDDVRRQLEALEKALSGKAWVRPTPPPPDVVRPAERPAPPVQARPFPPFGGVADPAAFAQAQELLKKALESPRNTPEEREAYQKAIEEYQNLMAQLGPQLNGLGGLNGFNGFNGRIVINGGFGQPIFPVAPGLDRGGRGDGRLGVVLNAVPAVLADQLDLPRGQGLVVTSVRDGSAAAKAGLKANDVLVEFAGKPVADAADFLRTVDGVKAGDAVDAAVVRKGKREAVRGLVLPEAVRPAPFPVAGVGGGLVPGVNVRGLGGRNTAIQVTRAGDRFSLRSTADGVTFVMSGKMEDGKAVPASIKVTDGDKTVDADAVDKLPAEYRDKAETLLGTLRDAGGRRVRARD